MIYTHNAHAMHTTRRITVANLILEYMLANAAAIRGFAPYFSMLVNQPATRFVTPWTSPAGTSYNLDWFAFAWVVFLSVLLVLGTKESATFNTVMTLAHLALVGFIIVAGLTKAKPANAQPFFPFEVRLHTQRPAGLRAKGRTGREGGEGERQGGKRQGEKRQGGKRQGGGGMCTNTHELLASQNSGGWQHL